MTANPTLVSRQKTLAIRGASIDDDAVHTIRGKSLEPCLHVSQALQMKNPYPLLQDGVVIYGRPSDCKCF